jgi:hypothetical protein
LFNFEPDALPNKFIKYKRNSKSEPLARRTMYQLKDSGGLNIVNIEYKLYALRLKHIQDIIVNRNVKFINFSIYWIGYQLRGLSFSL